MTAEEETGLRSMSLSLSMFPCLGPVAVVLDVVVVVVVVVWTTCCS